MNIKVATGGSNATIFLNGQFDFNAHAEFKDAYTKLMQDQQVKTIEINMAGVEYIDSSALGMLLMLRHRAVEADKTVSLSKPSTIASQVLEMAKFDRMFTIK